MGERGWKAGKEEEGGKRAKGEDGEKHAAVKGKFYRTPHPGSGW